MNTRNSSTSNLSSPDRESVSDNERHAFPVSIHHAGQGETFATEDKESPEIKKSPTNNSTLSNKALQVPREKRRGLLSNIALVPEFKDAREYPDKIKNTIVFIIATASMIGPMGTSIVFPAIQDMRQDLETTNMMISISVGIYLTSLGVMPLWWSSFSERFGRRSIYIVSFTLYIGFAIGCALAPSIQALIVFRVLAGGCSASVQAVGAGTISDLFAIERRGRALGIYYLGALVSPMISPIIGALLLIRWSWRSTQWFMVILGGFNVICLTIFLPETLRVQDNKAFIAKVLAQRKLNKESHDDEESTDHQNQPNPEIQNDNLAIERIASRLSAKSGLAENEAEEIPAVHEYYVSSNVDTNPRALEVRNHFLKKLRTNIESAIDEDESSIKQTKLQNFKEQIYIYVFKPLKALNFLRYPPVALSITFSAVSFGILYFVNMTLEYKFARDPYHWKSLYIGFAYVPNSVCYIFASIYGGKWTDHLLKKYREKYGFNAPEARISWNIFSAVVTFPVALLIMGWCFQYHTFWVTPLIGSALFGYASMMTIGPTLTYIVDSLPGKGATGVALNNLVRQTCATAAVFISDPMLGSIDSGPSFSIFAGLILIAATSLLAIKRWGTYWRENYDLQKLYDSLD